MMQVQRDNVQYMIRESRANVRDDIYATNGIAANLRDNDLEDNELNFSQRDNQSVTNEVLTRDNLYSNDSSKYNRATLRVPNHQWLSTPFKKFSFKGTRDTQTL